MYPDDAPKAVERTASLLDQIQQIKKDNAVLSERFYAFEKRLTNLEAFTGLNP